MIAASRRRTFRAIGALATFAVLVPLAWVQGTGQARVRSVVPPRDVALVLGAGLRPDGTPSTFLRRRLEAAAELYEAGTVRAILVSGDNSVKSHDEPTAMRDWLLDRGVPHDVVVRDFAGFDTHDTCVRANEVFGVTSAVVITQDYHLRRALFSCVQAGIDVVGKGVSSSSVEPAKALMYRLRELPASLKAAWDALTHRRPVHLGPREDGIRDALNHTG